METLDPKDWQEFRALAHRMIDETIEHLSTLSDQPAWRETPASVRERLLEEPLPLEPQGDTSVYEQFLSDIRPYPNGNLGPRFFGWVQGNGTPLAMMAQMLSAAIDPHMAGFNHSPKFVEQKVVEWFRELMGFPEGSTGLLLSGGSMASLTALAIARNAKAGFDLRREGLQGDRPLLTVYGSTETHSWASKAMELLGLGSEALRLVPVHDDFTIDLAALRQAIQKDREAGHRPIAVLATAGTVNTGATDDLHAIANLCAEESLWMHVDGAYGALVKLTPNYAHLAAGLERADSVAFDLHKWMYLPYDIACLLVRDADAHRATFAQEASYIATLDRGVSAGGLVFAELGFELTRSFKALKAWMCMKSYGIDRIGRLIEQNIEQARYLARLVEENPNLELMAPVPMNNVCFRYVRPGVSDSQLTAINQEVLFRLQEDGISVPSSTVLRGCFCLRACSQPPHATGRPRPPRRRDRPARRRDRSTQIIALTIARTRGPSSGTGWS